MNTVNARASVSMAHSPTRVWGLLSDFGNLSWMAASGMKFTVSTSGEGANMTRHLDVDGVGRIDERLELLEPDAMRLAYTARTSTGGKMMPDNYHVAIQLSAIGDGSRVDWEVRFETQYADLAAAEKMATDSYAAHGRWIDAALLAGS